MTLSNTLFDIRLDRSKYIKTYHRSIRSSTRIYIPSDIPDDTRSDIQNRHALRDTSTLTIHHNEH